MTFPQNNSQPQQVSLPKKKKKWPWVVGVVAALLVISAMSNGGDKDDPKVATARTASAEVASVDASPQAVTTTPASVPGLNTPVRDGKFEFVVTEIESGLSSLGDNPFLTEKAQGQFVIVTMTVQNTSDQPKSLSPSDQEMYDAKGRKFSADTSAAFSLDTDVAIWDEINPGNAVTMRVVFDMPTDAVPAEIELHDSMFSGGTRVSLT
ncbi:DUF4352 domain-containing protein [Rhodococcus globerulus]|uniref:DUF4352 domain-containing protein n=1 Tax=Rhodococcus globerulus TaxID=33008 RepID=UPI001C588C7D|nr:DUF4352 domain-containing protein [Rhodococcus globerulus]QXW00775.1 DUF4352 domain-containing protein [Rhodococcus globerulus]